MYARIRRLGLLAAVVALGSSSLEAQPLYSSPYSFTTLAGLAGTAGSTDGLAAQARFFRPSGLAVDSAGNVYVVDTANHVIRKISSAGVVSTLAGQPGISGSSNGLGNAARFSSPTGIALSGGVLYVTDTANNTVRKVTMDGLVTTLAGEAPSFANGWGSPWFLNGTGSAARFGGPKGIAIDSAGDIYVAEPSNRLIRKVTPGGEVTTYVGNQRFGGFVTPVDGVGAAVVFAAPLGLAFDASNNLFVTDGSTIRKVTPAGVVSTWAGSFSAGGDADGPVAAARFQSPAGLAIDNAGQLFVVDSFGQTIRRISITGEVTTLAGASRQAGAVDGTGSTVRFSSPWGVAAGPGGKIYVADTANSTIRVGVVGPVRPRAAVNDLSGDGRADIFFQNTKTGQRGFWTMNGTADTGDFVPFGGTPGSGAPGEWVIAGVDDFSGDGKNDVLWRERRSGDVGIWVVGASHMQGVFISLGNLSPVWVIAGTGDFNGDQKPDIVWQNAEDGFRGVWILDDTTRVGDLLNFARVLPTSWVISLVADFDNDGRADLLWTDTQSGLRGFWRMVGVTQQGSFINLDTVAPEWRISQAGDFNADGKIDIVWSNTRTGSRGLWLMNGTTMAGSYIPLPTVPTEWHIGNLDGVTVPGAPNIGIATAGHGTVSVTFTAPSSNGGASITGYTATCGTRSGTGTASPITVTGLTNGMAVTCTVIATNLAGNSAASSVSNSVTPTFREPGLVNISTRGFVGTGDNILIGGFIVGGGAPKKVIIKGRGPSLAALGVPGSMADPAIRLFSGSAPILFNDDWQSAPNAAEITSSGQAPTNAKEAAILTTATPGVPFTVHLTGVGETTGVAIVEVFELDKPEVPLLNISTRGSVLTGDSVMIGGFVVQGDASLQVLIVAKGPSLGLSPLNVPGVLADPTLELYQAGVTNPIDANDNWMDASNMAAIQSSGNSPTSPLESAILRTLTPGAYTAIVRGKGASQGIGMVEVYKK